MRNFGDLQRMARQMQEQMQRARAELAEETVEGSAGGGAVRVVLTGAQEVREVRIVAGVASDVEMLQDLVLAAVADALRRSKELAQQKLGALTGGLGLPPLS